MACALTQDFTLDCRDAVGGLKEVYFIELDNVSSYTESSGTISAITKASGKVFRKWSLVTDTSSITETITGSRANGSIFYAQAMQIIVNKMRVAVRNEIKLMAQNRLVAVAVTMEGTAFLLGKENGLMLEGGSGASGTAMGDRNGYQLDFAGMEKEPMFVVASAVISTLQS